MEKQKKSKSEIFIRFTSAMLGLPLVSVLIIFGNSIIIDILVAVISLFCSYEYAHCFKSTKKARPNKWYMYIVSALIALAHLAEETALREIVIALIPISILILVTELVLSKGRKDIKDVAITMFGLCYIPLMLLFLTIIRNRFTYGNLLIWYVFCSSWSSDIFAFFIGRKFGKHTFTDISPKKTVEGCVAGVIGAVIVANIYTAFINSAFNLSISYLIASIIVLILSIIGQIGDLAASSIKRYCGIKDFSELIPGHGGMLDRIDSVIFILPFAYILLGLLI